ncbi:MAG: YiiX family permuted papain-like enzyme [Cyanobacteria bacterium SBLK]|nr:YiiX family permuted papain-like enzyme [Cyanobacteria bacterium SBLK]
MLKILPILVVVLGFFNYGCSEEYEAQNGDIIFQTSRSSQSLAIQRATNSKYSHMGIIYIKGDRAFVYEAVEPVKLTPLNEWIDRGERGHYAIKRLVNAREKLTPEALEKMLAIGKTFENKHYDLYFEWSDDRIYCSELVWKIYKRALDIEIGKLQTLGEFDLSDPIVQEKVRERFGDSIPHNETVISPAAIFTSEQLVTVRKR